MQPELIQAFTSSKNEEFETPQAFFNKLNEKYNFAIDLAASEKNKKCENSLPDIFDQVAHLNALCGSAAYLNPPYGKKIGDFIKRAIVIADAFNLILVMLLPARVDTRWFNLVWDRKKNKPKKNFKVNFLQGRLTFELDGKPILNPKTCKPSCALFPSMLVEYDARIDN
jgi:phage N-6-adenine-methyltransferase